MLDSMLRGGGTEDQERGMAGAETPEGSRRLRARHLGAALWLRRAALPIRTGQRAASFRERFRPATGYRGRGIESQPTFEITTEN